MVAKAEVIVSSNGEVIIKKGEESVSLTPDQLFRFLKKHKYLASKKEEIVIQVLQNKFDIDVPKKSGKSRKGTSYLQLYDQIKKLGFTDKKIEHNILDIQARGIISKKWRKNGMVHIPTFLMEANEGEILKVLNFRY